MGGMGRVRRVEFGVPGQPTGGQVRGGDGRLLLLQRLEHEELLEDLGLAGLPDLPRQEHLVHHRVHLGEGGGQTQEVRYRGQEMRRREVMQGSEIGALGFHGKENALDNGSRGVSLWSPLAETAFESDRRFFRCVE